MRVFGRAGRFGPFLDGGNGTVRLRGRHGEGWYGEREHGAGNDDENATIHETSADKIASVDFSVGARDDKAMTRREADGVRVLLVEDNADLRDVITRALREAGYVVEAVADGAQGDALAGAGGFDALILDWMLPGLSGVEICRRLRDSRDFSPIIMLTAKDEIADRIAGLDAGADDYLVKPFHVAELLARLRSIVRRNGHQGSGTYRAGTIALDVGERAVRVADRSVALSAREFDLLEYLMRNADLTQTREAIEEHVWGAQFESSSNVVDVFVRRLRRKLGPRDADAIETVRGLGYRIRSH